MVTPENLYDVLLALKSANVRRAKFGDVEFEFEPEVKDPEPAQARAISVETPAAPQQPAVNGVAVRPVGYAALFPEPPRFKPAE